MRWWLQETKASGTGSVEYIKLEEKGGDPMGTAV